MVKRVLLAVLCGIFSSTALAQRQYTQEEIIGKIAECMTENAPEGWQRLIFTLDKASPDPDRRGQGVATHKVIVGSADAKPQDLKPCRPDYVPKAVSAFREDQDAKARTWTGITVTLEKDGRYSINYRYPK
jgi:hypothetical protein